MDFGTTKSGQGHFWRMEGLLPMWRTGWRPLPKGSLGGDAWRWGLPRPPEEVPWWDNSRTPQCLKDLASASTRLLVAYDESLHKRICGRMHCLSTNEDNHMAKSTPITTNSSRGTPTAFYNHVSRLHGETTRVKREQHHPHCHWSRMYQGGHLSALSRGYGCRDYRRVVQRMGFSLYRDPHATHFRLRYKIHVVIVQRIVPRAGSHTKLEQGLPPSNQWTIREDKSNNGRTVEDFLQPSS